MKLLRSLMTTTLLLLPTTNAWSDQPACVDSKAGKAHLAQTYGEQPLFSGLKADGLLLEVFANPSGTTWTVILTSPEGQSCLLAAGRNWLAAPTPQAPAGGING